MEYDFNKIKNDLAELKASVDLIAHIDGLTERADKGEDVTVSLRSIVGDLTENVSDADDNPLSERAAKSLEAEKEVLRYLDRVLCSRE